MTEASEGDQPTAGSGGLESRLVKKSCRRRSVCVLATPVAVEERLSADSTACGDVVGFVRPHR